MLPVGARVQSFSKTPQGPSQLLLDECLKEKPNLDFVVHLLAQNPNLEIKARNDWTPLSSACALGHREIVKLLISRGANVNTRGLGLETPLHQVYDVEIISALIDAGANPNVRNYRLMLPIDSAIEVRRFALVKMLLKAGSEVSFLNLKIIAGECNDPEVMQWAALRAGELLHEVDEAELNLLHVAILTNKPANVAALLDAGVDQFHVGTGWGTPVQTAKTLKRKEIIQLFKEYPKRRIR